MKNIKFRAWDKINEEMIPWGRLLNGYNLRNVFMGPEMCGLILMQFTGLKDKNGVDIFEGDIVRKFSNVNKYTDEWVSDVEPTYELSSIVFHEGSFKTTYKGEPSAPLNFTSYTITNDFEVIGNIYENSDLLEVSE